MESRWRLQVVPRDEVLALLDGFCIESKGPEVVQLLDVKLWRIFHEFPSRDVVIERYVLSFQNWQLIDFFWVWILLEHFFMKNVRCLTNSFSSDQLAVLPGFCRMLSGMIFFTLSIEAPSFLKSHIHQVARFWLVSRISMDSYTFLTSRKMFETFANHETAAETVRGVLEKYLSNERAFASSIDKKCLAICWEHDVCCLEWNGHGQSW